MNTTEPTRREGGGRERERERESPLEGNYGLVVTGQIDQHRTTRKREEKNIS